MLLAKSIPEDERVIREGILYQKAADQFEDLFSIPCVYNEIIAQADIVFHIRGRIFF